MSDLPRSTRALLALLPHAVPGPSLDVASFQGGVARSLACPFVSVDLTACNNARQAGVAEVLHTDTLPEGTYATIVFDAREYDPVLAAETVARAALRLAPGGVLLTTARKADVSTCFGDVTEIGEALLARNPAEAPPEPQWPVYQVEFQGQALTVQSAPGVFSPRGLDTGTAFMLAQIQPTAGARFLDLGCGTGIVSRIAYEIWGCQVVAVDVNARALRLAAHNAPQAEVVASDGFGSLKGRQFDLIASNPPYHTDFGVAKAFVEGAHAHLAPEGMLYLVVKRSDWYIQKVRHVFGGCRIAEENGYTVIVAQKRERKPQAPKEPPTTRKHAKRMAASGAKRNAK